MPNFKSHLHLNTLILTIVLSIFSLLSTAAGNEENAKKLFSEGNFTEALPFYEQLYNLYPNDAKIQYAYGVCMTETAHYSQKAKKILLQSALTEETNTKVYFYIGKIYHANNDFDTALSYYSRFEENAKKKALKEVDYNNTLENCKSGINSFAKTIRAEEIQKEALPEPQLDSTNSISESTVSLAASSISRFESNKNKAEENIDSTQTNIEPVVGTQLNSVHPKAAAEQEQILIEKIKTVDQIDTIKEKINLLEEINSEDEITVNTISINELNEIQEILSTNESPIDFVDTIFNFVLTSTIQYHKINQFKTEIGKSAFVTGWENEIVLNNTLKRTSDLRENYSKAIDDEKKTAIAKEVLDLELLTPELKSKTDGAYLKAREAEMGYWYLASEEEIEKLKAENKAILTAVKPIITDSKSEITENISVPDTILIETPSDSISAPQEETNHVLYKIQIGAYSKGLPEYIDKLYKKLSYLRKIDHYTDDRGVVVYTIGEVSNFDDANKLKEQIRQEGVKDAFVVAYNNGKRITLKEAKEITQ